MKITDPVMIRSLLRDEAAHYLAPFLHQDHSVAEAADLLRVALPKVHYWVRSLYDAGLLQVVAEVPRKGRAIKRYQAIATEFVIPAMALPDGHFERVMRRSNKEMTDALTAAGHDWVVAGDLRIRALSATQGLVETLAADTGRAPSSIHQSGCTLRISEAQAHALIKELNALRSRWEARSDDASDLTPYQLNLALAPLPD